MRVLKGWFKPQRPGEHGQVFLLLALLMPVLIGMAGLALDLGVGMASHRTAQNAADDVADAGAILIGDNDPNCSQTSPTCLHFTSQDIYNAFVDAVRLSGVPSSPTITVHLYDPSAGGAPVNTLGTVDVAAQFVDSSGSAVTASNGSSYLYDDSTSFPGSAAGILATVSWPQQTFFGRALNWNQYTVGAVAGYLATTVHPTKVTLAPFAVWWDPPYGACYAWQLTSSTTLGCTGQNNQPAPPPPYPYPWSTICVPTSGYYGATCPQDPAPAGYSLDDPSQASPIAPPPGTQVLIFDKSYKSDSGASNAVLPSPVDPNYFLGSNDYKGYFGWTGSQPTCLGSYANVTGNGLDGNNAVAAL